MPVQLMPLAPQIPLDRPVADCRVYERNSCALPATCQPASALEMKEMRWAATIADISLGGVRVLLHRRFEKGTGLALELPGDAERESNIVFVKVVHLRAEGNGIWALGCRFVSELSEDEMERLLTSTNHVLSSSKEEYLDNEKSDDDEPDATTTPSEPEKRYLTGVHLLFEARDGTVADCLIRRLNVARSWPLTPGKILALNGKTNKQTPWSLRIQVVEIQEQANGWEIRGQVVGHSSARDVLAALGQK